jgi:hypothetical protein
MSKKHIATYALYGYSGKRIATGFIYSPSELQQVKDRLESQGHPFHLRWRNEDCRRSAIIHDDEQRGSTNAGL